jgi:probable rRNA maturation factor
VPVEVVVMAAGWRRALPQAPALCRRAVRAALAAAPSRKPRGTVAIALADDATLQSLNRQFRGKDKPTNVLSFPTDMADPLGPGQLGDIALALQTLKREAAEQDKTLRRHLIHLVVHGALHLLGYDHERPGQARRMEGLERRILAGMGLPDPYRLPAVGAIRSSDKQKAYKKQ